MQWLILVNGKEKALFEENLNRMAGYKDKYEIKKIQKEK